MGLLLLASLLSAGLGVLQERMFTRFGKHVGESMFYNHLLSLPCFAFASADIVHHARLFSHSTPFTLSPLGLQVPSLWVWLFCNVCTQFVCSKGVYTLMSTHPLMVRCNYSSVIYDVGCTSAVTVNIVVTCRKFSSLLISIFYFNNPFTLAHWLGTVLVFGGTYMYSMKRVEKRKE